MKKTLPAIGLSASALMVGLSLSIEAFTLVAFVAFIPLFFALERRMSSQRDKHSAWKMAGILFVFTLSWQLVAGHWMYRFGLLKAASVFAVNALIFVGVSLPLLLLAGSRLSTSSRQLPAPVLFCASWLAFEALHTSWELSFPMFSLGSSLAAHPALAQWYSIGGALSGTAYLLAANLLLFRLMAQLVNSEPRSRNVRIATTRALTAIVAPIALSLYLYYSPQDTPAAVVQAMAVHPNLNCYTTRQEISQEEAANLYFDQVTEETAQQVDLILLPENAFPNLAWNEDLEQGHYSSFVRHIQEKVKAYPEATVLTGAVTIGLAKSPQPAHSSARFAEAIGYHYFTYNSIVALSDGDARLIRTKNKLVPFEETVPYPSYLAGVARAAGKIAPVDYYFSVKKTRTEAVALTKARVLPVVCYESAYGSYIAELARRERAGLLTVHLNEGWYDNPNGARLLQRMARARAIETGRYVLRSSNRGISDIISHKGEVIRQEYGKTATTLTGEALVFKAQTPFVSLGYLLIKPIIGILYLTLTLYLLSKSVFHTPRAAARKPAARQWSAV